jgi:dethiobiotin synthetase/adenosylmethionine--8-amino-7-oxononanoate aminotransferase
MHRINLFSRSFPMYQVMAANTDVGKTVFSTALVKAALLRQEGQSNEGGKDGVSRRVCYLKPVQTGFPADSDARHVVQYCGKGIAEHLLDCRVLHTYKDAVSPHLAADWEKRHVSDEKLLDDITETIQEMQQDTVPSLFLLETAGGVLSPTISGEAQADALRPLRLPTILVADYRLGGISATLSSLESLQIRGYDVSLVLAFRTSGNAIANSNFEYLKTKLHPIPVASLPMPPPRSQGEEAMQLYYDTVAPHLQPIVQYLIDSHHSRIETLESYHKRANDVIWWPFTQHNDVSPKQVTVIDSAFGDEYTTNERTMYDGAAAWWTNSLGHGNAPLAKAVGYAAGRYGHVLFPENIHQPALELAEALVDGPGKGWASRVFYTDDGSTASEVGIKMGLRYSELQFEKQNVKHSMLHLVGLDGSYHGDTIGAMDASSANDYNALVNWYQPRGVWLFPPSILFKKGRYILEFPEQMGGEAVGIGKTWMEVIDRVDTELEQRYKEYIFRVIKHHMSTGRHLGILVLEPILMGAGGMVLVDPMFHRTLIKAVRNELGELLPFKLPVMFDEVFVGLHRLGPNVLSPGVDWIKEKPDLSIYAKALTGGTVPLSVTLSTEVIFDCFRGPTKKEALLHGHSYTAHPIGCQVALTSLQNLRAAAEVNVSCGEYQRHGMSWVGSVWDARLIESMSNLPAPVNGVIAMGTVLAIHFSSSQTGYSASGTSPARLVCMRLKEQGVYARPLGNVVYLMSSMVTSKEVAFEVLSKVHDAVASLVSEEGVVWQTDSKLA